MRLQHVKGRQAVPLKVENDTFSNQSNLIWLRFMTFWNLMWIFLLLDTAPDSQCCSILHLPFGLQGINELLSLMVWILYPDGQLLLSSVINWISRLQENIASTVFLHHLTYKSSQWLHLAGLFLSQKSSACLTLDPLSRSSHGQD